MMKYMDNKKKMALAAIGLVLLLSASVFVESVEARSRSGGRSFSSSRSYSRPSSQPRQVSPDRNFRPSSPFGGGAGAFTRGLAGGVLGGFLGSMIFGGGAAHGMGSGGFGGSGFGLIEILLLGGLGYFLYKRFSRRGAFSPGATTGQNPFGNVTRLFDSRTDGGYETRTDSMEDPLVAGVNEIWAVDETFKPEAFKETAQDLFFKIQAGWTRRDIDPLKEFVGDQLLKEYAGHFAEMRQQGHINRLENIAVRNVELTSAGVDGNEIFVTIQFTANLLDYTVNDRTGDVVSGDPQNPVKFQENWTFARPVSGGRWKLEGIES